MTLQCYALIMKKRKAVIIGAGMGGLATALRLSSKGYEIEILEKYHQPGGRLNQIVKDGFTFDMGPSFFSMSYEFDELFKFCNIPNPLHLQALDPLYSVYFEKRKLPFLISKDPEKLAATFDGIETDLKNKVIKYLADAGKIFHDTEDIAIRKNFSSKTDYLIKLTHVPVKHAAKMFRSMWSELNKHFESEEVNIFFLMFCLFF